MNLYKITVQGQGPSDEGILGTDENMQMQALVTALEAAGHVVASAEIQVDKGGVTSFRPVA